MITKQELAKNFSNIFTEPLHKHAKDVLGEVSHFQPDPEDIPPRAPINTSNPETSESKTLNRFNPILHSHNILTPYQFGKKGSQTHDTIYPATSIIRNIVIHNNSSIFAAFIDFSIAYPATPRERLTNQLYKMKSEENYGTLSKKHINKYKYIYSTHAKYPDKVTCTSRGNRWVVDFAYVNDVVLLTLYPQ